MVVLGLPGGGREKQWWWLWRTAEMRRRYVIIVAFEGYGCGNHLGFGFKGVLFARIRRSLFSHHSPGPCCGEGTWRLGVGTAFGAVVRVGAAS